MMVFSRRNRLAVLVALAAAGAASAVVAEEINRDYHETFAVERGMKLVLKHGDGDVEISPWNEDKLDVQVRYRAKAANVGWVKSSDFEVEFRADDEAVYVVGHEPRRVSIGVSSFREYEYIYEIKAPDYLALDLEGEDGDVEIGHWRAAIRLELEDGDVELADIEAPMTEITLEDGDLEIDRIRGQMLIDCEDGDIEIFECQTDHGRIRTEDGDVTIDRCSGSLELTLSDGDARLSELAANDLQIRSGDGTVKLSLLPADPLDLSIRVGDGDVIMDLDEDISASFELETGDGDLQVHAAEVGNLEKSRRRVTGRLGTGTGRIYVRTDDGSVILRR